MLSTKVIIPCYNEEKRIDRSAFHRFLQSHGHIGLVFVNDGSLDRTADVLDSFLTQYRGQVEVLNLSRNSGKAEAVRQGMRHAFASNVQHAGYWDADLATPLESIPGFIQVLEAHENFSVAIGSRLQLLGHEIRRNVFRQWLGKNFSRVASRVIGLTIQDTQCGAKMFRNTRSNRALFEEPFVSRWIFDVEILLRLSSLSRQSAGLRLNRLIYEFALNEWEDVAGSKLKKVDFLKALYELAQLSWRYRIAGPAFSPDLTAVEVPVSAIRTSSQKAA